MSVLLTKIRLVNFKAFNDLTLHCAPLTLLCGLNGTGKSSVIQALLLLRQSAQSGALLSPANQLELSGTLADIGTGGDALFEDAVNDVLGFELWSSEIADPCSLFFRVRPDEGANNDQLAAMDAIEERVDRWRDLPPFGGAVNYVSAERIGPRKLYIHSETMARRRDLGSRGEFVLNYLSQQRGGLAADDPRVSLTDGGRVDDLVNRWLGEVSPGARLNMEKIVQADALVAGFSFDRAGDIATRSFRATNVGFGLSYVLPVLAALLAKSETLCLIENPEAHLHPRGQTRLAKLFAQAALAGVQTIVETHSDHFLDGVRIAIRDGLLSSDAVAIHYFGREGTNATLTSPQVDEDGRLSHWPDGFFDQHEENLAYLLSPKQ